jgi:phage terminase large subunit
MVNTFLRPQAETKLVVVHKNFATMPTNYKKTYRNLPRNLWRDSQERSGHPWQFFHHLKSGKLVVENVNEKNSNNHFLLHVATFKNDAEIVKAAIEGGADLDEKNYCYHYSPFWRGYAPPAVTLRSI